jgi:hypothetical protein
MNSSEIKRVTLINLIIENRVTLKEEIALQYQLSIKEKEKIKIENEISRISDYFIKYLDVNTHFFISKNTTIFFNIDESSIRFIKSASNVQMMKKFCELIKDFAINKRWIKSKKFRITAKQSIFLLIDAVLRRKHEYFRWWCLVLMFSAEMLRLIYNERLVFS